MFVGRPNGPVVEHNTLNEPDENLPSDFRRSTAEDKLFGILLFIYSVVDDIPTYSS